MNPVLLRNRCASEIRKYFSQKNLSEAITPLLVKSGGIEPCIDPLQAGENYVLPTSPEISLKKTLAMMPPASPGIYEIAHSFRKEVEGKLHLTEFTMVEWYRRDFGYLDFQDEIIDILEILTKIEGSRNYKFGDYQSIRVPDLIFSEFGFLPQTSWNFQNYKEGVEKSGVKLYLEGFSGSPDGISLIGLFTLVLDHAITGYQKKYPGLLFIHDFPPFLRGMAKLSADKWAMRIEAVYNGVEICSGYQEEDDPGILREIWKAANEARIADNRPIHPIDNDLLEIIKFMKGVSGMALGLERAIMITHPVDDIRNFRVNPFN